MIVAAGVSVGMRILVGWGMLEGFVWSGFVVGMAALGLLACMYDPLLTFVGGISDGRAYFEREFVRDAYRLVHGEKGSEKLA